MTEIILGPPGTGKTTTLIEQVSGELAGGVSPDRIGHVSFTKRAAREAIDRACEQFKLKRDDFPHFSTLHSLCFKQLGLSSGDVLQGTHLQEFADDVGIEFSGKMSEDGVWAGFKQGDRLLYMENLSRIRAQPLREVYDEYDDDLPWNTLELVSSALRQFKHERQLLDFTDMLSEFVAAQLHVDIEVLLVDEAQDLSRLQWLVIEQLAKSCRRVIVAGDDDQAIYRWAGADVEHFIAMTGSVSVLGRSHRVPPAVQTVALDIISNVEHRRDKRWEARAGVQGAVERAWTFDEVEPSRDTLVLARNSYVLDRVVEPSLRNAGMVYERGGMSSVREGDLEAIRTWEALRRGQAVSAASARGMYKYMRVGVDVARGKRDLAGWEDEEQVTARQLRGDGGLLATDDQPWWEAFGKYPDSEVGYVRAVLERRSRIGQEKIVLSTIHGAKGGEADHVVLLTEMARRSYDEMDRQPEDEARVWYVGVTRAKERLTVVDSRNARRCPWL